MKKNNLIGKKVISKKYGEGVIKYVSDNEGDALPYAVEFKKSNTSLHTCENHCEEFKGYWCTFDKYHFDKSEIIKLIETKAFTKKDLKEGDIITLRNGKKGRYEGKRTSVDCLLYHNIEDNLTNNGLAGKALDIVKVERIKETEVVFERKEETTEILDEIEKAYLSSVIKPFRAKVKCIKKEENIDGSKEFIQIRVETELNEFVALPYFKKGSMYKGMIAENSYSLEELGL